MSRESAGAAIRTLRESRDLSLADLAELTGVSIMGLSYLERGARKPHKSTVQKVENGLGLPAGTYARLLVAPDPVGELAQLVDDPQPVMPIRTTGAVVVERHSDTDVLEAYAEAQLDTLNSAIARLPPSTSDEYETYILSVVAQCVKAELLAANSWRVAVNGNADPSGPLLTHLKALEATRGTLLARLPASLGTRFDKVCARSGLPEPVIATLLGVTAEQIWDIRNRGAVPTGALARVRAFLDVNEGDEHSRSTTDDRRPTTDDRRPTKGEGEPCG